MSIWKEALSTCHEGLTSDLGSAGGSVERTASCSDVFSPGENTSQPLSRKLDRSRPRNKSGALPALYLIICPAVHRSILL